MKTKRHEGTKSHRDKLARKQICTKIQFCTRVKKQKKILKWTENKIRKEKSNWPGVEVRGNIDSKIKVKKQLIIIIIKHKDKFM